MHRPAGTKHTLAKPGPTRARAPQSIRRTRRGPWASAEVAPNIIHSTNIYPVSTRARPQIRSEAETDHGSDVPVTGAGTGGHRDHRKGRGGEDLEREAGEKMSESRANWSEHQGQRLSALLLSDGCGMRRLLPAL